MVINENTRISALIRANPAAIEAIASLNRHFEKLRNPVLRKLLAGRVTIAEAARIGKCSTQDFFRMLEPLGFRTSQAPVQEEQYIPEGKPGLSGCKVVELDVRPLLDAGKDPLSLILDTISSMKGDEVLSLINSFVPLPLIRLLEKKGYSHWVEHKGETVITWFRNPDKATIVLPVAGPSVSLEELRSKFEGKVRSIDVRGLEMPQPMMRILAELERLPEGEALYVQHSKVPQFLFPELQEKKFRWSLREDAENDVKLFIYR